MYKAIIFDRDGTLNRTTQILRPGQTGGDATDGYVLSPDELELLPHVIPALSLLRRNDVRVFVFTQQNCIGKGLASVDDVNRIHAHMNKLLAPHALVDAFYLATHKDDPRAKPSPAMIHEILSAHSYTPPDVLVVGDSMRDCKSAIAAKTDFAWVRDDLGRVSDAQMHETGFPVFDNVLDVVRSLNLPKP